TRRSHIADAEQHLSASCAMRQLANFAYHAERIWRYWLNRRSSKRDMPWERFKRVLSRYPLPRPRIVHSYA
ncbi:MAG: hypothetical protein WCI20_06580, partial [bacterium]